MKTSQSGSARKAVQIVLAAGVAVGAAQAQAADIFLRITGLPGESMDDKHKGDIDVLKYSQVVDNKSCRLGILKSVDRASPGLASAASTGGTFASATLFARKAGKDQVEYYTITMQGVSVGTSDQSIAGSELGSGTEAIVLVPKSMTISYTPQKADGSADAKVESVASCK